MHNMYKYKRAILVDRNRESNQAPLSESMGLEVRPTGRGIVMYALYMMRPTHAHNMYRIYTHTTLLALGPRQ